MPTVGGTSRAIHVPQKLSAHSPVVWVLSREIHEDGLAARIELRIEICALHINEADLLALVGGSVPYRLVQADASHGHAEHGPERLERRRRREVASAAAVQGFELACDKTRSVVFVDVVAFICIHPPYRDGGFASLSSGVASRHLLPDALRIEEAELCGTSNGNSAVVENLAGEVIPDAARVAVFGAADRCLDVAVVVWYLDTEATVLGHVVDPHLCCNTKQKSPA